MRIFIYRLENTWKQYKGRSVAAQQSNEAQKESSGIPPELDSYLADIFGPKRARLDDELAEYLAEGTEPLTCDVFAYWRKKRLLWPELGNMARDYLAPTASSASSERVNSAAKNMVGLARHSLSPQTMQMNACLRSWEMSGILEEATKELQVNRQSGPTSQ